MRKQSISQLSEVRFAVLESGGNITFVCERPTPSPTSDRDPGEV
jgi:uncharacterized membrane protein YcaP (DUF421 family)